MRRQQSFRNVQDPDLDSELLPTSSRVYSHLSLSFLELLFIPENGISPNPNTHPRLGPAARKAALFLGLTGGGGASTAGPAITWETVQRAFRTPQPRAQEHKLWGRGGMGLNPGFPRAPEEWDVGQAAGPPWVSVCR